MTLDKDFDTYMRGVLDNGHTARPDADAPPPDTWQLVLAQVKPQTEEENEMSTSTISGLESPRTPRVHLGTPGSTSVHSRGFSHYLNLAATIAIIATLAAGGWFAAMQLNQPGTPDSRLAVLPATPEVSQAQTCDVEPLSVGRVMEIVKNPVPFLGNGPTGDPDYISVVLPSSSALYEVDADVNPIGRNAVPTNEQFGPAEDQANSYLDCLLTGTQGQVWTFYSPLNIQQSILAELPVFRTEEEVRGVVEERIQSPAIEGEWTWQDLNGLNNVTSATVNPDRELAQLDFSSSLYIDQIMFVGVMLEDADGAAFVQTTATGRNLIPNDPMLTGTNDIQLRLTLVKARNADIWFVVPYPSLTELGVAVN